MKTTYNKFLHIFSGRDDEMAGLLGSTFIVLLLRVLGAISALILNVAIARLLGVEGAGFYFLALSIASIGAVITRLGLDHALLRFVATESMRNNWLNIQLAIRYSKIRVACASFIFIGVVFTLAPNIALWIFKEPQLAIPLRWISLGVLSFAMMMLASECLKGLRKIRESMLVSGVIYPCVALLLILPLGKFLGSTGAALAYVSGTSIAAIFGFVILKRELKKKQEIKANFNDADLLKSSRKLWVMSIINSALLPWAPLLLLGVWGTAGDTGIFGAATRIAMIAGFFLTAVNTVAAPKFGQLFAAGDIKSLHRIACRFTLVVVLVTSPVFVLLVLYSDLVMSLFGQDFAKGGKALAIIAAGQAINLSTGSVGYLLMMTGFEKDIRNTSVIGAIFMIVMAYIAIPMWGIVGAAMTSAFTVALMNLMNTFFVYRRLGFLVIPK